MLACLVAVPWRGADEYGLNTERDIQIQCLQIIYSYFIHLFFFQQKCIVISFSQIFFHIQDRRKQMSQKTKIIANCTIEMKGNLFSHMHRTDQNNVCF